MFMITRYIYIKNDVIAREESFDLIATKLKTGLIISQ